MSEESSPNKSQQPPALPEAEYEAIYVTVSETAQGRRFLEEYARRCSPTDTEATLAAIERMHTAVRADSSGGQVDLLLEMAEMAQAIARLRAEITAIETPPGVGPAEAVEELDAIVHTTERATSRILTSAEQMQEIAWTLRESGANHALCDLLDAQATEIYTACTFQDLTGQRTRKVIDVLRYLEHRIHATVSAKEMPPATMNADSTGLKQADVDVMMQPPGSPGHERKDATLEDISRVMQSLEPSMTFYPEKPTSEAAPKPVAEVRPELSVVEAVIAEPHAALAMADWAVVPKPAAPQSATEGPAPMIDWVVEDRSAPRPDSEPAWMILQRMEAEFDAAYESEDAHAVFTPAPPIPPAPVAPLMSEPVITPQPIAHDPEFFVPEEMSGLAATLRPPSMLPPPELDFRRPPPPSDPLAELQSTMEASDMRLAQPFEDEPQQMIAAELPPFADAQADGLQPAPDVFAESIAAAIETPTLETSELMKRAAAIAVRREPSSVSFADEPKAPAEPDPDDFLFAETHEPADFLLESAPQAMQSPPPQPIAAAPEEPAASQEWEAGTYPHPALVTPRSLDEPQAAPAPEQKQPEQGDPLAPLRAMSDEEKIALFS
jgi:hypothetical protein